MKVLILAGGFGTRLSEKTQDRPKPMIEIGEKPILWHLMNIFSSYGHTEFIIALGYMSNIIKTYFLNFYANNTNMTIELENGRVTMHQKETFPWIVHLVETGYNTQTGGRMKRIKEWIGNEPFMMTYGDGLADVNLDELVEFHQSHGKLATVTAVQPRPRFGGLELEGAQVIKFAEKAKNEAGWINGGFFVLQPEVLDWIEGDETPWEKAPLEQLARMGELVAYKHNGFWQPMDTLRDYQFLQSLWEEGNPPWVIKKEEDHLAKR